MPKFIADEFKKVNGGEIEGAVKRGYLRTDEEFLKRDESGGACCVTAVLQKGGLVVSNAGDCRAVLSRGGKAEALTSDHRASREDEKERIENLVCPRYPSLLLSCTNSANAIEQCIVVELTGMIEQLINN
jgi:protein phosphatase 1L